MHSNIKLDAARMGEAIADGIKEAYKKKTDRKKKVTPFKVGYDTRCASPDSFDVVMSSMLGYGAFKLVANAQFGQDRRHRRARPHEYRDGSWLRRQASCALCRLELLALLQRLRNDVRDLARFAAFVPSDQDMPCGTRPGLVVPRAIAGGVGHRPPFEVRRPGHQLD